MNTQQLFDLFKNSQFAYFEGNFFHSKLDEKTTDENQIQLIFTTLRGGKGNSISIESCEENKFDLSVYIFGRNNNETEEFLDITEKEMFEILSEILNP